VGHTERGTGKQGGKDRIFEGFYGGVFQEAKGLGIGMDPPAWQTKPESRSLGNADTGNFLTDFLRILSGGVEDP
jgi:hypothetical protein